jgi:hypothetical protein
MKTFKEFAAQRWLEDTTPADDPLITQAITRLGLKDPKILPGATDQKTAVRAMNTPEVKNVIKKEGPAAGGAISATLTGDTKKTQPSQVTPAIQQGI